MLTNGERLGDAKPMLQVTDLRLVNPSGQSQESSVSCSRTGFMPNRRCSLRRRTISCDHRKLYTANAKPWKNALANGEWEVIQNHLPITTLEASAQQRVNFSY